jgi:hypothetical protein
MLLLPFDVDKQRPQLRHHICQLVRLLERVAAANAGGVLKDRGERVDREVRDAFQPHGLFDVLHVRRRDREVLLGAAPLRLRFGHERRVSEALAVVRERTPGTAVNAQ